MKLFYSICSGISIGIILGFIIGAIKKLSKKTYSEEQIRFYKKIVEKITGILKYITILLLSLGFVWCVYFLVLAIFEPSQADYANNMAELIGSVLTVISIIFAFAEFLGRKE